MHLDVLSQTIQKEGSGAGNDIVIPVEYEESGLQLKTYLPYVESSGSGTFRADALSQQSAYYAGSGYDNSRNLMRTNNPFAVKKVEQSPLSRANEQGDVGDSFQPNASDYDGNTIKTFVRGNNADEVFKFDESGLLSSSSAELYYTAGSLLVTETIDQNANSTFDFKDKMGRIIAKKNNDGSRDLWTYYVYDLRGNMTHIIPPMAAKDLTVSWDANAHLDTYVTKFIYDSENRLTEKHTPEARGVFMAYDNLGRAVMTQDPNLRAAGRWQFTKYDYLGRVAYTGIIELADNHATVQSTLDAQDDNVFESRNASEIGYSNTVYPTNISLVNILSITYYDDYDNPVSSNF